MLAARQHLGVPTHCKVFICSWTRACQDVYFLVAEYYRPVHCDVANLKYLHRDGEDSRINSATSLVGSGGVGFQDPVKCQRQQQKQ